MNDRPGDSRNWASLCLGIVTLATILAAATSAGIFAASPALFGATQGVVYPGWLRLFIMLLAVFSLTAYAIALGFGLTAPLFRNQETQRAGSIVTAAFVLIQAYAAVSAVFLILIYHLFKETQG